MSISYKFCLIAIACGFFYLNAAFAGTWTQNDWSGGPSASPASEPANKTGWTNYNSKDSDTNADANKVSISPANASTVHDTNAEFDGTLFQTQVTNNSIQLECTPSTITADAITSGSSKSWSHTVGSGNDRLLVVAACHLNSTISSITYGAQSFTRIIEQSRQGDKIVALWYLINPAVGTNTITVTDSANWGVYGAHSFFGVDQTSPIGVSNGTAPYSSNPSINLSSAAGEVAVDIMGAFWAGGSTISAGPGQTERWNIDPNGMVICGSSTETSTSSNVTMSWSISTSANVSMAAATLKPVSCP